MFDNIVLYIAFSKAVQDLMFLTLRNKKTAHSESKLTSTVWL